MVKSISVLLEIPILAEQVATGNTIFVGVPAMIFHKWLPMTENDAIVVDKEDKQLELWFNLSCIDPDSNTPANQLPDLANIAAKKAFASVTVMDVADELADYIFKIGTRQLDHTGEYESLEKAYKNLADEVYSLAITHFNRLISYFRNQKQQYWLHGYPSKREEFGNMAVFFKAKVKIEEGAWLAWREPSGNTIRLITSDQRSWLEQEEWAEVRDFVVASSRASLVGELLANARYLAGTGHRRSALIESITALEVAVNDFGQNHNKDIVFTSVFAQRMDVAALRKQIEHMGLSGSIRYLFPIIFTEDQLPKDIFLGCWRAIEQRNNIVHKGQRDIGLGEVMSAIHAISVLCSVLENLILER